LANLLQCLFIQCENISFKSFSKLKVGNCPDFLTCRWRATYRWKALDEGYNVALDLISIEGLQTKLWAPFGNFGTPTIISQNKDEKKDPLELPQKKTSSPSEICGDLKKMINPYKSS
jgi:hypothetical protein